MGQTEGNMSSVDVRLLLFGIHAPLVKSCVHSVEVFYASKPRFLVVVKVVRALFCLQEALYHTNYHLQLVIHTYFQMWIETCLIFPIE